MTDSAPTIGEVNAALTKAGLPPLNPHQAQTLFELESRDTILGMIRRASTEQNARGWLCTLFERAGLVKVTSASTEPARTPPGNRMEEAVRTVVVDRPHTHTASAEGTLIASRRAGVVVATPASPPEQARAIEPSDPASGSSGSSTAPDTRAARVQYHVYAGKAALTFEQDETRAGIPTVSLDAAAATGPRQYAWSEKVRFQFSQRELPILAAFLTGLLPSCEFDSHGEGNSKRVSGEYQLQPDGGSICFWRIWAKGQPVRAVPMDCADAFWVASLVLAQVARITPGLAPAERRMLLDRVAKTYKLPAPAARAARPAVAA